MPPKKRTKIIATVGPVTASSEQLQSLYDRGVNIIRFNFSHADHVSAREIADRIHALNTSGSTALALLLDTKGPELRTGDLTTKIAYKKGDVFRIYTDVSLPRGPQDLTCDYPYLMEDVVVGGMVEIDSGLFHVRVREIHIDSVEVEALGDALIGSRRHVNLPGVSIRLPGITDKDKEDILFAIQNNYHFIAASFIRTADNVREIREFLAEHGGSHIKIISKIENAEGIANLISIVEVSDGIMVARGDLGIEVPIEKVPRYQKEMVDLCRQSGKYVIVATHMLESMIENPFPTRAEVSDIYRAVLQGADATMLSGETTTGRYPLESVEMMARVIREAEVDLSHKHHEYAHAGLTSRDIEKKSLIRSAITIAEEHGIENVFVFTRSGLLARLAAAYRPNVMVHAFSPMIETVHTLHILYGVVSHHLADWSDHRTNLASSLRILLDEGILTSTDRVVAVTDIMQGDREIPVLEIIHVADMIG